MRIPKISSKLYNGYTISLVLHTLILLLMVLYSLKPTPPPKWHTFEWELNEPEFTETPVANIGTKPGEPSRSEVVAPQPSQNQESSSIEERSDTQQATAPVIPSPVITTPNISSRLNDKVSIPRNRGINALRNIGTPSTTGPIGFSSNLLDGNGDAYIISQPKPNIIPDSEGEVTLQFKLLQSGTVNMSSVTVLSYTSSVYVEAVKKVMPQWRFGFSKSYNPDRQYRIRCNFVINE